MFKRLNINEVILYLTLSDVFTWGISAIFTSLAGLYLATKFNGNVIEYIGIGTSVYFVARSAFQLPVGAICDRIKRDYDEVYLLMFGNITMGFSYLMFPIIRSAYFYLFLQFLFGMGAAFNLVTWRKLFAKNLNLGKEGKEYAGYDTIMSGLTALFCVMAGYIANQGQTYFEIVIIVIGALMLLSSIWPFLILNVNRRRSKKI